MRIKSGLQRKLLMLIFDTLLSAGALIITTKLFSKPNFKAIKKSKPIIKFNYKSAKRGIGNV